MRPPAFILLALVAACNGPQKPQSQTKDDSEPCVGLPIEEWHSQSYYWDSLGYSLCTGYPPETTYLSATSVRTRSLKLCIPELVERFYEPLRCEVDKCIADTKARALAVKAGDLSFCEPYWNPIDECNEVFFRVLDACPFPMDSGM